MENSIIRNIAREKVQQYRQCKAPIDVKSICNKENIEIIFGDFTELQKQANKKISGFIIRENDSFTGKTKIYVNDADLETRQNFTIAHELGHYYLHMKDDDNGIIISFRGDSNPVEREANIFASEILMPKDIMYEEYNKMPFPTVGSLARIFNVSKATMEIRLQELELEYIG